MTKSIFRSVKQTLVRLTNLSLAAIISLSSLVAAAPILFASHAYALTPALAPSPAPCAVAQTPFLTITQNITNDPDSGNYGNWATDAFTEHVSVWVGTDSATYCANAYVANGTFVTTGPLSPEHGLALPAGINGTFTGGENYTFPASLTLSPSYSVSSPKVITLPDSSTAHFSWWVNQVFPSVVAASGSNYTDTYSLTYVTPNGSTWTDADAVSGGNQGDITPVYDSTSGIGYGTIQSAIDVATPSDTIVLGADMTIGTQVNISKAITLDGAGHHLNASFAKTGSSNNAAIGITHSNVTIKNLVEDGTGSTNLHGINVYVSSGVALNNVTVSHNGHSGLVVNGSSVTATNFNASNNGWNSVNVDPGAGVTLPSVFTLISGNLNDSTQIWSDGSFVGGLATVTVNATGYSMYKVGGSSTEYLWTNQSLTNAATITKNGVTNLYSTIIAAVNASQDGDTIKVAPGNYNLVKDDTTVISGQTGWYLPITKNNITLVGIDANGNEITDATNVAANIYSTQETANGSWSTQNLITVFGDSVTVQGLGIMNKIEPNKAIEVLGNNFKAIDDQFLPVPISLFSNANNYGGDDITKYGSGVYLNNNGATSARTATITNNIFKNSGVTFDSFKNNWTVNISNNTFDGNKIWRSGGIDYYYSAIGSTTWANQPDFTGSTISIHNNKFLNMANNQAYVKIKTSMTGTYNATNNYWGSSTPDFSSITLGNVIHDPYFTNSAMTDRSDAKTVPDSSGNAFVNPTTPQLLVSSNTNPITVNVADGTTNASIDFSLLISGNTGTIPQTTVKTTVGDISIPASTIVTATGSGTWNGVIEAPTIKPNATVTVPTATGSTTTVGTVIEVGSGTFNLTFDKAVRLFIPGQAGKLVGFVRNGVFTQISTLCSADNQAAGDALDAGGNCYVNVGNDMVVWTKHFTTFVTYTQAATTVGPATTSNTTVATSTTTTAGSVIKTAANNPIASASNVAPSNTAQARVGLLGITWYLWLSGLAVLAAASYYAYSRYKTNRQ